MDKDSIDLKVSECRKLLETPDFYERAEDVIKGILQPGEGVDFFPTPVSGQFYHIIIGGIKCSTDGKVVLCSCRFESEHSSSQCSLYAMPKKVVLACVERLVEYIPELEVKRKQVSVSEILTKAFKERFKHWKDDGKDLVDSLNRSIADIKNADDIFDADGRCIDEKGKKIFVKYWEDTVDKISEELNNGKCEDDIRTCDICGLPMEKGYYLGGDFACDDECCLASYDGDREQMEEDFSHVNEDWSDVYWTEWGSVFLD